MSVLIKDMEIPTMPVLFCVHPDGKVFADLEGGWKEYKAVPLPPHGRCIDADALWVEIHKICDRRDAGIISDLTCLQQILSALRHAPTIIPAEEGDT